MSAWWNKLSNKEKLTYGVVAGVIIFLGIVVINATMPKPESTKTSDSQSHLTSSESEDIDDEKKTESILTESKQEHKAQNDKNSEVKAQGIWYEKDRVFYKTTWTKEQLKDFITKIDKQDQFVTSNLGTSKEFKIQPKNPAVGLSMDTYSFSTNASNDKYVDVVSNYYDSPAQLISDNKLLSENTITFEIK